MSLAISQSIALRASRPKSRHDVRSGLRLRLATLGLLVAAAASSVVALAVPSAKIGSAALIHPTNANTFYGASTTSTNGLALASRPNEIVELARALNNNVDEIYDFVRNNVDVTFIYGLQKGALGAIIDKAGTPFDQAQLMVELLRQSGYVAGYQAGTITLTAAQFSAWTNITKARAACQLLANGGIPAAINGGTANVVCTSFAVATNVTTVQMAHVWVSVVISGTTYLFDPSYKPYTFRAGANLATVAGLTTGAPLTQATTGMTSGTASTVPYVRTLNGAALNTQLNTYANNLQTYVQNSIVANNALHGDIKDLVGGRDIQRYVPPPGQTGPRQTTLAPSPYSAVAVQRTWTGGIPDQYRTTLKVRLTKMQFTGEVVIVNDQVLYVDEIYGRKLNYKSVFNNATFNGSLDVVDEFGTVIKSFAPYTVAENPGYSVGNLTLTAAHPYAASANPALTTTPGDYMDFAVAKYVRYSTPFTILNAWGDSGRGLVDKWGARNDVSLPNTPANGCEDCWPQIKASAGDGGREQLAAAWIAQASVAARLHAQIGKSVYSLHHSIGVVSGDSELKTINMNPPATTPDYQFNLVDNFNRIDVDTAYSVTSLTADLPSRKAVVHAIAATVEALEGSVAGQINDLPDTVSTASRFEWGNSPPAAEDPSVVPQGTGSVGPRRFYEFTSTNSAQAPSLVKTEGQLTTTNPDTHDQNTVVIGQTEAGTRKTSLSGAISTFATAGFRVVASEEAFLGPGQRTGAFEKQAAPTVFRHRYSKQRGGALVATRYSTTDTTDPVEIAHIAVNTNYTDGAASLKGGGGGAQATHDATYDPGKAADVLKSRFVDRSNVLGVDLQKGGLTYSSPASLTVGNGGFPYALTANLIWRGGSVQSQLLSKRSHTEPQAPWSTNWNNTLTISGSGLEVMGDGDVRATAGTVASFLAMQDIYKSAVSSQREVAAVLVGAWWQNQLTGNVVSVNVGADTKQFVRRYNDSYIATGSGAAPTLTRSGTPPKVAFLGCGVQTAASVTTRGFDYTGTSFQVKGPNGDVQNFANWAGEFLNLGSSACRDVRGFRLTSWTFPQGITVNLVYQNLDPTQPDELVEVNNSLGRKIRFYASGLDGFDNGLSGADLRSVSVTRTSTSDLGDNTITHTDPSGAQSKFFQTTAGNRYLLKQAYGADNSITPSVQYTYDTLYRVKDAKDAVALQQGTRGAYQFLIGEGVRGERVDPAGGRYTVFYDLYRRPMGYMDELGRTTSVTTDGRGRVKSYTYPEGNTSPVGNQELFQYDDRNNTISLTRVPKNLSGLTNLTVTASWNPLWNKPDYIIDAKGCRTDFTYISSGPGTSMLQMAQRPAPTGAAPCTTGTRPTYTFTYNGWGQLLDATDPTGIVTRNAYNPINGNLESTTFNPGNLNAVTTMTYDANGDVLTITDPRGNGTSKDYDPNRRNTMVRHHNGSTATALLAAERKNFDVLGRVWKEEAGTAFSGTAVTTWQTLVTRTFTPTSKVESETNGAGNTTTTVYDALDRPLIVTDPIGRKVATKYNVAGEAECTWRGWNSTTGPTTCAWTPPATYAGTGPVRYGAYTYSANGLQLTTLDANNNFTTLQYDGFDRLSKVIYPSPTLSAGTSNATDFEQFLYDANNNRTSVRKRSGATILYIFDNLNRQTRKQMPVATDDVYSDYDLADRPNYLHFGSPTGVGIDYSYDLAKRLQSENAYGRVLTYTYDQAGNRTRLTYPDTVNWIDFDFDPMNRIWRVRENGATSGAGVLATYTLDPLSRRAAVARGNGTTSSFGYDLASRLNSMAHDVAGTAQDMSLGFTFTSASQIQSRTSANSLYDYVPAASSKAYVSDGLNRYATVAGTPFTYDTNGNLKGDGTRSFTYDIENRLLTVTGGAGMSLSYDPLGRLRQTVSGTVTTQFLYDGTRLIGEYDGTGPMLRRYVHGPGADEPIAWYEGATMANRLWLHGDERGSIVGTSDGSGSATTLTYGPYGEQSNWTGVRFRYTGQTMLPEAKLYYYKARVYDPGLGRFLQTDPIGSKDDLNLYTYAGNDAANKSDPTGLFEGEGIAALFEYVQTSVDKINQIVREELDKRPGDHNNLGDALRHADASKRVAQEVGPLWSFMAGSYHEYVDGPRQRQPLSEMYMDLNNNREGRRAASENREINLRNLITHAEPSAVSANSNEFIYNSAAAATLNNGGSIMLLGASITLDKETGNLNVSVQRTGTRFTDHFSCNSDGCSRK